MAGTNSQMVVTVPSEGIENIARRQLESQIEEMMEDVDQKDQQVSDQDREYFDDAILSGERSFKMKRYDINVVRLNYGQTNTLNLSESNVFRFTGSISSSSSSTTRLEFDQSEIEGIRTTSVTIMISNAYNTSSHAIIWPSNIEWVDGEAPNLQNQNGTGGKHTVVMLLWADWPGVWIGFARSSV